MLEAVTAASQSDEELEVHGTTEGVVQQVSVIDNSSPKKCRRRRYIEHAMVKEDEVAELDFASQSKYVAIGIHPSRVAIYDVHAGIVFEGLRYPSEAIAPVAIIGVQPSDNVALRTDESFVERLALAAIWFRGPLKMFPPFNIGAPS